MSTLINAAILPRAAATAEVVREGLAAAGHRGAARDPAGDGGATDLAGSPRCRCARFLGARRVGRGVLHSMPVADAMILEVGGTSTNVSLIQAGRPRLAYVRVGSQVDVPPIGGRVGGRRRRRQPRADVENKVVAVGPRSAHIAGLPYAVYASPDALRDGRAVLIAPRPGDAADHLALDTDAGRFALTTTCAANALGTGRADSYADARSEGGPACLRGGRPRPWYGRPPACRGGARDRREGACDHAQGGRPGGRRRPSAPAADRRGWRSGRARPAVAAATGQRWETAPHAEVLSSLGAAASLSRPSPNGRPWTPIPALLAGPSRRPSVTRSPPALHRRASKREPSTTRTAAPAGDRDRLAAAAGGHGRRCARPSG